MEKRLQIMKSLQDFPNGDEGRRSFTQSNRGNGQPDAQQRRKVQLWSKVSTVREEKCYLKDYR